VALSDENLTLAQAWPRIIYLAQCKACKHRTRVDLKAVAEKLGESFPINDLRPKLRCTACGHPDAIICTLYKESTGNLVSDALEEFPMPYD
jgi:transcription elongation factor Elf1